MSKARQRAGRPGPGIFDPGFQNPGFFDPEKNLILNPVFGPDLNLSPENFLKTHYLYQGFLLDPEPVARVPSDSRGINRKFRNLLYINIMDLMTDVLLLKPLNYISYIISILLSII